MTVAARTGFVGLITNVACTQAPPGALLEAENVVLRRPGCVEPRDGVKLLASPSNYAAWGFSARDTDYYTEYSGGTFTWFTNGGTPVQYADPVLGAVDPQLFRRDVFCYAESRGNFYLPYEAGVLKLVSGPAFEAAGLPIYLGITGVSTSAGSWLGNNEQAAYRAVMVRTDADGFVVRSSPTGAVSLSNTSGGALGASVTMTYDSQFHGLFDTVEVYRTRNFGTSVTIDDEMQLVASLAVSQFGLAGGFYAYTLADTVAVADRGATLYTSPSRGGINQRNEPPPAGACMAAFKGSLFLGNVRSQLRTTFSNTWAGVVTGSATGIGSRVFTGDVTLGSPTLTNASVVTGLKKGQLLLTVGFFPDGAYITNIVGTTLTVSANSTATSVGITVTAQDAINLNGLWVTADEPVADLVERGDGTLIGYLVTPSETGDQTTYTFETVSRALGTATVQATHGSEYSPPLPEYDATAKDLEQDVWPGAVRWSKRDEPEHFTAGAYSFVGDKRKAVLGLVPTRDALFVLKEDGVFRLTGSGATEGIASPWRVDPYDPTTFCMLPSSVKSLNGRAYFLSNRGVVAFGDGGAELLSQPVNDQIKPVIDYIQQRWSQVGYYELESVIGATAAVFARESEYTIMLGGEAWPLVYNEATSAWTSWKYHAHGSEGSFLPKALFNYDREGRICYSLGQYLYGTRLTTDSTLSAVASIPARNDRETAVTVTGYDAGSGLLVFSGPITALADDAVEDVDGKLWRIVNDVNASTAAYVDGLSVFPYGAAMDFTTGVCVLYRTLRTRVAPQTFFGEPFAPKANERYTAMFSRFIGPCALRFAYTSQMSALGYDSWTETDARLPLEEGFAPFSQGHADTGIVPNAHYRAWLLSAGVRWVMTHGYASLEGLYLHQRAHEVGAAAQVAA